MQTASLHWHWHGGPQHCLAVIVLVPTLPALPASVPQRVSPVVLLAATASHWHGGTRCCLAVLVPVPTWPPPASLPHCAACLPASACTYSAACATCAPDPCPLTPRPCSLLRRVLCSKHLLNVDDGAPSMPPPVLPRRLLWRAVRSPSCAQSLRPLALRRVLSPLLPAHAHAPAQLSLSCVQPRPRSTGSSRNGTATPTTHFGALPSPPPRSRVRGAVVGRAHASLPLRVVLLQRGAPTVLAALPACLNASACGAAGAAAARCADCAGCAACLPPCLNVLVWCCDVRVP